MSWDRIFRGNPDEAETVRLSDVVREQVQWLWSSRIPMGRVTLLDGDPGLGKSTLTLDIAARVTNGGLFPDGDRAPLGNVVVLSAEDGLGDTVRPRLEAAGADLSRIIAVKAIRRSSGGYESPPDIRNDIDAIARIVTEETRLLIVDPLMAYLPDNVNPNRDHEIRRCLLPLSSFAQRMNVAVLLVRHLKKNDHGHGALYAGGGSIGISGAARSVLMMGQDPDNPLRRVVAAVKTNLCAMPPSLAFVIEPADDGTPTLAWEMYPVEISADQLLVARKPKFKPFPVN